MSLIEFVYITRNITLLKSNDLKSSFIISRFV